MSFTEKVTGHCWMYRRLFEGRGEANLSLARKMNSIEFEEERLSKR